MMGVPAAANMLKLEMEDENASSNSDSDYLVEEYIRPKRRRRPVNDESADLLGNFDDAKRKEILDGKGWLENEKDGDGKNASDEDGSSSENEAETHEIGSNERLKSTEKSDEDDDDDGEDDSDNDDTPNTQLSREQLNSLMRGAAKTNRHVLYVTNLNFETGKEELETHFGVAGAVKSIRIPKKRRGGFAFVEMADLESYQRGFQLHNTELQGRHIKVQISEAGKRKSANKKNIIKQKNRKLAEMRNEQKSFTKSGKFYDKALKKEKAQEAIARTRWRKKPSGSGGGVKN